MRVGAADSKRGHAGAPRVPAFARPVSVMLMVPIGEFPVDVKWRPGEINLIVNLPKVRRGHEFAMVQAEHCFDKPRNPCSAIGMPNIPLDASQRAGSSDFGGFFVVV